MFTVSHFRSRPLNASVTLVQGNGGSGNEIGLVVQSLALDIDHSPQAK